MATCCRHAGGAEGSTTATPAICRISPGARTAPADPAQLHGRATTTRRHLRPHQPRPDRGRAAAARARPDASAALPLPVDGRLLRAHRGPQLRRPAARPDAGAALRRRFRRSVRGARPAPAAARQVHAPAIGQTAVRLAYTGLDRRRRSTELRFEPAPSRIEMNGATCQLSLPPGGQTLLYVELRCNAPTPAAAAARAVPALQRRGAAGAAAGGAPQRRGRDLERGVQRGAAPRRADLYMLIDRNAGRAVSLCRHPLVQHRVRPRRHHHRLADAVARPGAGARRAALSRRQPGDRSPIRWPMPSRARSCTRCATARWRNSARCRSAAITAASMRRRCSSCWPAPISTRTGDLATMRARSGRHMRGGAGLDRQLWRSRRRRLRRIPPQDREGPRQPGLEGQPRFDLPRRRHAGRGADRAGARCRATSMPPGARPPRSRARSASRSGRGAGPARPKRCASASRQAFWCDGARHLCAGAGWRKAALPGAAPPMPAMRC